MVWSQAGFRYDVWSWAAVGASRGPWKEMYRHTSAIGGVMRSAHAVPQPGGVRHPDLVTARPPAARHLDGLHPLSSLATTVFIRGFFDR